MSSEMRDMLIEVLNAIDHPDHGDGISRATYEKARTLLARTEAGADGAVACYRLIHPSLGATSWIEGLPSDYMRDYAQREGTTIELAYTRPQDASGDAEDAARWRHVRQDGLIWRVNMLALAKDDIDILFGAKADAAVDEAMHAKEAK